MKLRQETALIVGMLVTLSTFAQNPGRAPDEKTRVHHLGLVAPDVIQITISAGRVEYGRQVPYTKQGNDIVDMADVHRFVRRGDQLIGTLVGKKGDLLCTMDSVVGEKFDTDWADRTTSYAVRSVDDPDYSSAETPRAVHRKSKPSDLGMIGIYQFDCSTENAIFLRLPRPLIMGKTYQVLFRDSSLPPHSFIADSSKLRSEAVHVNQIGFRPDEPAKVAFLSCWMGNGGGLKYQDDLVFTVVEDSTSRPVFTGHAVLAKAATDKTEDAYKKNYNGTDVHLLDFTALNRPGRYRVCVTGIGCSFPFEIGEDVWRKAFAVSARGLYHQRSGIPLGPPYTTYTRPRPFHPEDGLEVYASKAPLMDTGNGLNQKDSNFGNLVKGRTDEWVTNAWGGYMDAGDWDRRVQHLKSTFLLLELAELFPDYFAGLPLNIPESGTGLPDIVNEALFNLEFYRRLQLASGGIRGGIESSEHPRRGEASHQESLTVMAYAPDVFSSWVYAGVSARAARWLAGRDEKRAAVWRESALRAMDWAEGDRERSERDNLMGKHPALRDVRNYAAAELFCLTGELRWNDIFLATTLFKDGPGAVPVNWDSLDQGDAAWVYARTGRPGVDPRVQEHCRTALIQEAELRVSSVERTGFRWAKHPYAPVVYGALSSPENCVNLVRAHVLTGKSQYLRALVLAAQTGAGANPVNMCYTTGLGQRSPQHPLQLDHRITHQAPPPGLTVGGPMDNQIEGLRDPFIGQFAGAAFCPPWKEWPALEAYWDVFWDPLVCEYTVHKPMAGNIYVWGYLAARRAAQQH